MDFVKEGKLDDEIKRRQAEWERVRKAEDPIEAPPEVFDNRTLYEKLKEQHEIKKKEFEDQYSLKSRVRGIDTEEADFLNDIDSAILRKERDIRLEEKLQVEEIKALASNKAAEAIPSIKITVPPEKKENKQANLLSKIVVIAKNKPKVEPMKKETDSSAKHDPGSASKSESKQKHSDDEGESTSSKKLKTSNQATALAGLCQYDSSSSDSE